jgi:hypothetical protein
MARTRRQTAEQVLKSAPRARPVKLARLKKHPENYKTHPEEQLLHLRQSLREYGPYRNIVAARDLTILAGHGIAEAAAAEGYEVFPVVVMDLAPESPAALKILALDNETPKFAEADDRKLTEILRRIRDESPGGLLGTGYDDGMLAALLMVTRPASEIRTLDEAAEWVGMPEYEAGGTPIRLVITFKNEEDRARFVRETHLTIDKVVGVQSWSTRWPFTVREDAASVRFGAAAK